MKSLFPTKQELKKAKKTLFTHLWFLFCFALFVGFFFQIKGKQKQNTKTKKIVWKLAN